MDRIYDPEACQAQVPISARWARRGWVGADPAGSARCPVELEAEVAHVVVVVTAGVLDQVVLVILLGLDPVGRRLDRRRDRRLPLAALLDARGDELGGLSLRGRRRKD